jgi:hypothetical protein
MDKKVSSKVEQQTNRGPLEALDFMSFMVFVPAYDSWLRGEDLNLRPLGYE